MYNSAKITFGSLLVLIIIHGAHVRAESGYLPPWQTKAPNITDLALIYQGGGQRPQWTLDRYAPYVSYRDPKTGKEQWLFDGFLFIEFANKERRTFEPIPKQAPANQADWVALLEKNFATNDGVPNLDVACRKVAARIGAPARPRQVVLVVPDPIEGQTNWGSVDGRTLDFGRTEDRLRAAAWYLDCAIHKWKTLAPDQLQLAGFYWIPEGYPRTNDFVNGVARLVHARGLQFFWIPYWQPGPQGRGADWRSYGFDAAWLQPNYFFHPEVQHDRLDDACAYAKSHGMGLEFECDSRMLSDRAKFEPRFDAYLDAFVEHGARDKSSIAYYEGGGTLFQLANSADPNMRAHYDRISRFILERQQRANDRANLK